MWTITSQQGSNKVCLEHDPYYEHKVRLYWPLLL